MNEVHIALPPQTPQTLNPKTLNSLKTSCARQYRASLVLPFLPPPGPFPCRPQATQDVLSRLPLTTPSEFNSAVAAAAAAYPVWRDTPVPVRARVMLRFQDLIRAHTVRGGGGVTSCKDYSRRTR